ncbi:FAD-dependent oxidoreductase [Acidisoma cellulosilytica]|uniref:FAD-dependent oxidoreductase n=1 Tax=Acidisoma cellulosilyticum TaxID=2802395 RepID=A0A964E2I5_9PROT|nr:FAD-binding oxidoreductase [Acidisoma cellulosilyticum]MCB8879645.1 FAD-dependent oxidoreductase [Acidisoma cellulosilyticum]
MAPDWRSISLWTTQIDDTFAPRPSLESEIDVDVAIIGAGYTGLWTAYYLKTRAPQLRIAVLEAETAGFGASSRNGGWVIGGLLGEDRLVGHLAEPRRRESWALLHGIPDEVARVTSAEGIDCDFRKGGMVYCAARYPEQEVRLRAYMASLYQEGLSEDDFRWLSPAELNQEVRVSGALGGLYSPHCATIQPAKLARGLARLVEGLGVMIYEKSPVTHWHSGKIRTASGQVKADWVVPAVESFAGSLPPSGGTSLGRYQLPVHSLIVATEPLPEDVWAGIGLTRGQGFGEFSRQVTYGQRSCDNRLVFGARGGYRFGGRIRQDFTLTGDEIALRRRLFTDLFPQLKDVRITHSWGGNLGMGRRFRTHMLIDRRQRLALAGGYGGEGVGATNLAGRTLADLILGRDTLETRQPWVIQDRPVSEALRPWEPEPFRWLGYNAIMRSFTNEDSVLADPRTPPWRRRMAQSLSERMEALMTWKIG